MFLLQEIVHVLLDPKRLMRKYLKSPSSTKCRTEHQSVSEEIIIIHSLLMRLFDYNYFQKCMNSGNITTSSCASLVSDHTKSQLLHEVIP